MTVYVVTYTDDSDYYCYPSEIVAVYSREEDAERHVNECNGNKYSEPFTWHAKELDTEINKRTRQCWMARVNTKTGKITLGAKGGFTEFYDKDSPGFWKEHEGRAVTQTYVSFVSLDDAVEKCREMARMYVKEPV